MVPALLGDWSERVDYRELAWSTEKYPTFHKASRGVQIKNQLAT